jgi:hypothetical protein
MNLLFPSLFILSGLLTTSPVRSMDRLRSRLSRRGYYTPVVVEPRQYNQRAYGFDWLDAESNNVMTGPPYYLEYASDTMEPVFWEVFNRHLDVLDHLPILRFQKDADLTRDEIRDEWQGDEDISIKRMWLLRYQLLVLDLAERIQGEDGEMQLASMQTREEMKRECLVRNLEICSMYVDELLIS